MSLFFFILFVILIFFFFLIERLEEIKKEIVQVQTDSQSLPQAVTESIQALENDVDTLLTGSNVTASNGTLGTMKSLLWKSN